MFRLAVFLVALSGVLSTASAYAVASDDTGKYLAATSGGAAIISNDYGSTWNTTSSNQAYWSDIASDSTGQRLALSPQCNSAGQCFTPYYSKDRGATWSKGQSPAEFFQGISSDSSGDNLVMGATDNVYISSDGGASWQTALGVPEYTTGYPTAYSANGKVMYYVYTVGTLNAIAICQSGTCLGFTSSPSAEYNAVSTDATGKVVAGTFNKGYYPGVGTMDRGVYLSLDTATTYTPIVITDTSEYYNTVSVTDDASLVFYGTSLGVYQYNVAKKTITKANIAGSFYSISSSKTGKFVVVGTASNIYVSSNYGIDYKLSK